MNWLSKLVLLGVAALFVPSELHAAPKTAAQMKALLDADYGGDPLAYTRDKRNQFIRMACNNRVEAVQALMDAGLNLYDVEDDTRYYFIHCGVFEEKSEVLDVALDPDSLHMWERRIYGKNGWTPLLLAIYGNDYDTVRVILENGAGMAMSYKGYMALTREEQLVLAMDYARSNSKGNAIRAFQNSRYKELWRISADRNTVRYIKSRATGKQADSGGGGFLGSLMGVAAGAVIGGDVGTAIAVTDVLSSSGDDQPRQQTQNQQGGPLNLPTMRATLGIAFDSTEDPTRGIKITQMAEDGPTDIAGLEVGDIITKVGDMPVATLGSVYVATETVYGAETYEVTYLRGGEEYTATYGLPKPEPEPKPTPVPQNAETASVPSQTPAESGTRSILEDLERLASLRDKGIITEAEFETLKAEILNRD